MKRVPNDFPHVCAGPACAVCVYLRDKRARLDAERREAIGRAQMSAGARVRWLRLRRIRDAQSPARRTT